MGPEGLRAQLVAFALILGAWPAWAGGAQGEKGQDAARLAGEVSALLETRCLVCHAGAGKKGGLDLSTRAFALEGGASGEPALVPGDPGSSVVIEKLAAGEMPPRNPLPRAQVELVRAWIAAGAPYAHEPLRKAVPARSALWSLRPIARPQPPVLAAAAGARNPIDAFVRDRLKKAQLDPTPEADRRTLIRRLTLDLTGLPPTPEEIDTFLRDQAIDAYERLVERLLASPRYGERWGRHWLDVARFGESHGYETNMPRYNAWPYRDYVIRAFNQDVPYSRFIEDQIAGAGAGDPLDPLSLAATGFLVAGTHDGVGNATREGMLQQRMDDLDDMIAATCSTFLGLSVQCARCHDHKFDPIPQRDYYAIQALLAGVQHGEREVSAVSRPDDAERLERIKAELGRVELALDQSEPLADPAASTPSRVMASPLRNVERFRPVRARAVRLRVLATADGLEPCLDEIEASGPDLPGLNLASKSQGARATASSEYEGNPRHRIVHLNDDRLSNERSWIPREAGKGWARIAFKTPVVIDRVVWGRDRTGVYRDRLAVDYRVEVETEPGRFVVVASSADRAPYRAGATSSARPEPPERAALLARQAALRERLLALSKPQTIYAGMFTSPEPTHLLARGDPMQPGDLVAPASLTSVEPRITLRADAPDQDRRRALAQWLADPANPLPARVLVNRVWQYHFGAGLVATPNDFGALAAPPSHPELLDWLASQFIASGWSIKHLQRLIVLSATYRQASAANPNGLARDAQNVLLWRFAPRRLEAEAIRDAILAASGELDSRMGGPSYSIWIPNTNYVATYEPRPRLDASTFRRMVYQLRPRGRLDTVFGVFDCPDAAQTVPRRLASTTAAQALAMWNSAFVLERARALAARARQESGPDPGALVERVFALVLGRAPSDREREAALALVHTVSPEALARVLYNANEFLTIP